MFKELFFVLWFFLPVGLANMVPIPVSKVPFLKGFSYPLDFGLSWGGRRVFGDHKTLRGLVSGVVVGVVVVALQRWLYGEVGWIRELVKVDYSLINPFVFGLLCAVGALLGDAIKSFFKRRVGVQPGKAWFPFDQIDYVIGGMIFTSFYIQLSVWDYVWIFVVWFLLHPVSTFVGYLLKLKDSPI